jgi:hypothetical protein
MDRRRFFLARQLSRASSRSIRISESKSKKRSLFQAFEIQNLPTGEVMQRIQIPPLAEGEIYLCGLVDANGDVEHTVIVSVNNERASWQQQMDWAKSIGADLTNRVEQAVIRARRTDLVEEAAYWSNTTVEWDSACAWCQYFYYGNQYRSHKSAALRAVAVRRFKD